MLAPLNAVEPTAVERAAIGAPPISRGSLPTGPRSVRPIDMETATRALHPQAVAAAPPRPDSAVDATYRAAIEAARAYGGAYGVSFAAVRDDTVLWTGSAGRARDGVTPLGDGDPLVIGSVMKTFVAATILQLAEAGSLRLDDRFATYLPERAAAGAEITIRQMLDHTSGLADVFNDATRIGIEEHPEHAWTAGELLATIHAPWYEPGQGYAYANTNYYLLGLLIERVTGRTLARELDRRFLDPLALDHTRMLTAAPDDGGPLSPAWATIFWASGAMSASAADLARFGDALYGDELITDATRAEMLRLNRDNYGLGVQKIELPGAVGHGHTGMLNTYTSLLVHLPEHNITLALLVNRTHVDLGGMLAARPPDNGASLLELAGVKRP